MQQVDNQETGASREHVFVFFFCKKSTHNRNNFKKEMEERMKSTVSIKLYGQIFHSEIIFFRRVQVPIEGHVSWATSTAARIFVIMFCFHPNDAPNKISPEKIEIRKMRNRSKYPKL